MKKGVLGRFTSLIVVVMLLSSFAYFSAASPPVSAPSEDEDSQNFGNVFEATGTGHWKACVAEGDSECTYEDAEVNSNDLDLTRMYSDFGIVSGNSNPLREIQKLKFVLEPTLFGVEVLERLVRMGGLLSRMRKHFLMILRITACFAQVLMILSARISCGVVLNLTL